MRLTPLYGISRSRRNITSFGGLDRSPGANGAKLGSMLNMTSDDMPFLASRAPRAVWSPGEESEYGTVSGAKIYVNDRITAAAAVNGKLCFATDREIWADGKKVGGAQPDGMAHGRSIVPFGGSFVVVPDGLFARRSTGGGYTAEKCGQSFYSATAVTVTPKDIDGDTVSFGAAAELPENPNENDGVILTSGDEAFVYEYKNGGWVKGRRVYPSFSADGIGTELRRGDSVILKNAYEAGDKKRAFKLVDVSKDFVTVDAPFVSMSTCAGFSVTRFFPVLDFAVESNNRIWGCRYGKNVFGEFVNEIYACSLGDPLSWDSFDGISTDAFVASLGCPGEFTGAAVLDGKPVFFKEDRIITVSGLTPQSFTVVSTEGRGVENGASKSLVNLNEMLFYKTESGIAVFDGALVRCISEELGSESFTAGAAGTANGKYRVVLTNTAGEKRQYVYDSLNGVWHIEDDDENAEFFVRIEGGLCSVCLVSSTVTSTAGIRTYMFYVHDGTAVRQNISIFGDFMSRDFGYITEAEVPFFAETRETTVGNGSEVIRSLVIRAEKDENAVLRVGIIGGNDKEYREVFCTSHGMAGSFTVPVNTPRYTSFRLRFGGTGRVKILSIGIISEKTGEVNAFGY